MDLMRYLEETQLHKEMYGEYPPTWEEYRKTQREALQREALRQEAEALKDAYPVLPLKRRRKYWK
jgi:hypothetical protein